MTVGTLMHDLHALTGGLSTDRPESTPTSVRVSAIFERTVTPPALSGACRLETFTGDRLDHDRRERATGVSAVVGVG